MTKTPIDKYRELYTVKVYVSEDVVFYYLIAPPLLNSVNLPTLSQAFEEFLNENYDSISKDNKSYLFFHDGLIPFDLEVNWQTKKMWDGLSCDQKNNTYLRFNSWLKSKIKSIHGGKGG